MNKIINLIKLYWNRVQNKVEKYPILYNQLRDLLKDKVKESNIWITDNYYLTTEYEKFCLIAPLIPLRFRKYIRERFDCDDFAREYWTLIKLFFPQLPLGMCEVKTNSGLHMLNFFIYRKPSGNFGFSFIEPQTGKVSYFDYEIVKIII